MICSDTHCCTIFLTNLYQRGKLLVNSLQLCLIFSMGIFKIFEALFICIVTGVDPDFFNNASCLFSSIGSKVNIGNQGYIVTSELQFLFNISQVFSFLYTWCSNSDIFTTGIHHTNGLFYSTNSIHGICRGHTLNSDRIQCTHRNMSDCYFTSQKSGISI